MDSCIWVLYGEGNGSTNEATREALREHVPDEIAVEIIAAPGGVDIIGVAGSHVDDFFYCGRDDDPRWIKATRGIEAYFKWGDRETDESIQTGVPIKPMSDHRFRMDQLEYVESIDKTKTPPERRIPPERRRLQDSIKTDEKKRQMEVIQDGGGSSQELYARQTLVCSSARCQSPW